MKGARSPLSAYSRRLGLRLSAAAAAPLLMEWTVLRHSLFGG